MKENRKIHNLINKAINIIFWLCMTVTLWFVLQVFIFASFKIPSDSMEPGLITGDNILVWKPTVGPRLFNLFASMRNEQTDIYRIPGFNKIKRNDILVFNFPHPNSWDKIEMHILKYYIKRCVGIPGDTLFIRNGFFHVEGVQTPLGNMESQKGIAATEKFQDGIFQSFPFDSIIGWNIKDFGPLYIPAKGDSVTLDRTNFRLYKKLIEWEQQESLQYKDSMTFLNGKPIYGYRFQENYYFMAGDKGMNSQDSRYWGLLPEEYIVGKAWIIWKSVDPYTDKFRWDRFLKIMELALQTAGNNRQQLEKVIQHYQGDKQKEDAARFLIRNMLGKYYQEGDRIDKFHQFIDSAYRIKQEEYDQQTINDTYRTNNKHQQDDAKQQADLQQLNANFLITQIDAAFQVWQRPWNKHLSFDEFCEWILPYRIGSELPEIWREEYYNAFAGLLTDSILTARDACIAINNELIKLPIHVFNDFPKPADIKPSSLIHIKFGLCGDYTNLAIYAMRSIGIPVTTGNIPHWGHSNNSHAFNLLYGEDGNYYDFAGGEHHPGDHLKHFDGIPKVYQKTFSVQQTSLVMTNTSKEELPAFFKNPFMKDITEHFPAIHPQTVSVPLNRTCNNKYAYLCVFDPQGGFPVDWGKISDKKVTFNHIGPDIIYQVNSYEDNSLQPLSSPFVVDSTGKVTIFECRREKEDLYLERKYREPKHLEAIPPAFVGGRFQGSDYVDFRIAEDLYTFTEAPSFKYTTIEVNPKKSYKYYRYQSSPNLRGNMAELEFYDTNSQQIQKGEIIGTDNTSIYNPHATKYNVFDGDPLTFFHTRDSMSWAGLALPKPTHINKIRYIIRNDDNGIRKGNLYELFYIDESGAWASAGKQTAEQDELLIYKQIPQGTLYWLRNYTRGKEERIFTYEKGKQVWW